MVTGFLVNSSFTSQVSGAYCTVVSSGTKVRETLGLAVMKALFTTVPVISPVNFQVPDTVFSVVPEPASSEELS